MYSASDCRFLRRIGEPTDTDHEVDPRNPRAYVGRLHHPWGVAIAADNDTIAVTDSFNHCVQLFSASNGRCLGTIGNGKGSTPGSFNKPAGVAWDEGGNIFIADSGNHRVQVVPTL